MFLIVCENFLHENQREEEKKSKIQLNQQQKKTDRMDVNVLLCECVCVRAFHWINLFVLFFFNNYVTIYVLFHDISTKGGWKCHNSTQFSSTFLFSVFFVRLLWMSVISTWTISSGNAFFFFNNIYWIAQRPAVLMKMDFVYCYW